MNESKFSVGKTYRTRTRDGLGTVVITREYNPGLKTKFDPSSETAETTRAIDIGPYGQAVCDTARLDYLIEHVRTALLVAHRSGKYSVRQVAPEGDYSLETEDFDDARDAIDAAIRGDFA